MSDLVTIDGTIETGEIMQLVSIWENYHSRKRIVAKLRHGTQVEFLGRRGKSVKIRSGGKEGFVSYWFVKELKTGLL